MKNLIDEWGEKEKQESFSFFFFFLHLSGDNRKAADVSKQQMGSATSQLPGVKTQTEFWSK